VGACQVRADSLLGGINSLFSKTGFPVVVELIPCSAAQGISLHQSLKLLNSQTFSRRDFRVERLIRSKFSVVSLL
jgi:hypothetical protein